MDSIFIVVSPSLAEGWTDLVAALTRDAAAAFSVTRRSVVLKNLDLNQLTSTNMFSAVSAIYPNNFSAC